MPNAAATKDTGKRFDLFIDALLFGHDVLVGFLVVAVEGVDENELKDPFEDERSAAKHRDRPEAVAARELDDENGDPAGQIDDGGDEVGPPVLDPKAFQIDRVGDLLDADIEEKERDAEDHDIKV